MEEYGWIVITVLATLLTMYSTIVALKDRGKKPVDELRKEFNALDKTVSTLITTINMLNDHLSKYIDDDNTTHKEIRDDIKLCNEKITDHEKRIWSIEHDKK